MQRCADYQELMLELLYDLVEPDVRLEIEKHLNVCSACESAFRQAEAQQRLLTLAARLDIPDVEFQIPEEIEEAQEEAPATLVFQPQQKQKSRSARWQRWAAAAMLLVTLGIPAWFSMDYLSARSEVREQEQQQSALRSRANEIEDQLAQLNEKEHKRLDEIVEKRDSREFQLKISGPVSYKAGAPNEYAIETLSSKGKQVPSRILSARVLNENNQVIHEQRNVETEGEYRLKLPADLPFKAGSDFSLEVVAAREGSTNVIQEKLGLAAPVYVTHLTTDKPLYQPGEPIHFRSLTLERFSLKPATEPLQLIYTLQGPGDQQPRTILKGGNGIITESAGQGLKVAKGPDDKPIRGIGGGIHWLDLQSKEGPWILRVHEANNLFPPQQRLVQVRDLQQPRFAATIQLDRDRYAPGDSVKVTGKATRLNKAPVANARVDATLKVDGKASKYYRLKTDDQGAVEMELKLPAKIQKKAALSFQFQEDGRVEKIEHTVPLVQRLVHVDFYPEGGDLIAGAPNRVYFQATSNDEPIHIRGRLMEGDNLVARIETTQGEDPALNQGRGVVTFTPEVGKKYRAELDEPKGMMLEAALPEIVDSGVVLHVANAVTNSFKPIKVALRNVGKPRSLLIGAYCRGRLFAHRAIDVGMNETAQLSLTPSETAPEASMGGVTRVTVFEQLAMNRNRKPLKPLAERLVYRQPRNRLALSLSARQASMKEQVTIKATDENQKPTPAVVMVKVLSRELEELANETTARSMPTHFYLTSELRRPDDIEHADFFLSTHPKAPMALDLLLGTQGWRRFAEQNPEQLRKNNSSDARRFLVFSGSVEQTLLVASTGNQRQSREWAAKEKEKVAQALSDERAALLEKQALAEKELEEAKKSPAALAALAKVSKYEDAFASSNRLWSLLGVALVLVVIILLGKAIIQGRALNVSLIASSVFCLLLLIGVGSLSDSSSTGYISEGRKVAQDMKSKLKEDDKLSGTTSEAPVTSDSAVPGAAKPMTPYPGGALPPTAPGPLAPPGIKPDRGLGTADQASSPHESSPAVDKKRDLILPDPKRRQLLGTVTKDKAKKISQAELSQAQYELAKQLERAGKMKEATRFDKSQTGRRARTTAFPPGGGRGSGMPAFGGALPGLGGGGAGLGGFQGGLGGAKAGGFLGGDKGGEPENKAESRVGGAQAKTATRSMDAPLYLRAYSSAQFGRGRASSFTDTVYWHPILVLPEGQATVSFPVLPTQQGLSISVLGHTLDGRLGATKLRTTPMAEKPAK